jgi:hypothetical protein
MLLCRVGAALTVGFFGPLIGGMSGWRLQPAHFVERHGLIVIIALGESLIAIGLAVRGTGVGAGVIVAALLRLVVATSFWLAYFDFFAIRFQQVLAERRGAERIALARDVYSYLHLPMVAGIVLSAFAMREAVAHVGNALDMVPALALCGGSALYLFTYVAVRLRVSRSFGGGRLLSRTRVHGPLPSRLDRAGDCRPRPRRCHVDHAPRVRDHLVARGPLADPRSARPGRFLLTRRRRGGTWIGPESGTADRDSGSHARVGAQPSARSRRLECRLGS